MRLALFILAYNLGNFLRRLCLPKAVKHWSLRSLQVKFIKIGGRLVRHARRLVFQLVEVAIPKEVFRLKIHGYGQRASTQTWRGPVNARASRWRGRPEVRQIYLGLGVCLMLSRDRFRYLRHIPRAPWTERGVATVPRPVPRCVLADEVVGGGETRGVALGDVEG